MTKRTNAEHRPRIRPFPAAALYEIPVSRGEMRLAAEAVLVGLEVPAFVQERVAGVIARLAL